MFLFNVSAIRFEQAARTQDVDLIVLRFVKLSLNHAPRNDSKSSIHNCYAAISPSSHYAAATIRDNEFKPRA